MSNLKIEPLQLSELDDFIRIYWSAFAPPEADMILPMLYPLGLTPDLMTELRTRLLRETKGGKLGDTCFAAKDSETGEIIAVSKWAVDLHPATTRAEAEAELEEVREARFGGPTVEGVNRGLGEAFLTALVFTEWEVMQGRPYVSLRNLATHPDHQRKGAGALLLRDGLARFADRLGLPVYLDAGAYGRPLYEKYGFEVVRDFPFDGRKYGGRSEVTGWNLTRLVSVSSRLIWGRCRYDTLKA
ncbi:hypothetical protein LTR91_018117 [Friedmanniomyces endolithicus]|uniref:N-acetyltransferase domain-containing protein n=1 Tax=Friedmanniomyces endolithicus TaxID=329885 RepID=A0AAN6HC47_9PEZI|nr:hypothetical protein LTR94_008744 [Friedmanniomyces endolithicus]KAK0777967.1 hypothetical protein LTR59_013671 [Friedmanniomyces endolithicus]KAK0781777.1 hypothetical protein LTR38_013634 [Friedmanniomyces endolithicus]KAK0841879.1 hypothetical protein LTR03_009639 [Friedmanniomyces endolithicus]KAK0858812.1 hypothetical protein LTS02_009709 [Friedmanniomyces endolithicus]